MGTAHHGAAKWDTPSEPSPAAGPGQPCPDRETRVRDVVARGTLEDVTGQQIIIS